MRILIVNDFASNASLFQKFLSHTVNAIYISPDLAITQVKNPLFFKKNELGSCVKQIRELSNGYDVFIAFGWFAAAVCYLANVKYIMYFVGSFIEPKYRIWKKFSLPKRKFFDGLFKDTLDSASKIVTYIPDDVQILEKYRKNVSVIFPFVDTEMFHSNHKKIDLGLNQFVFFSPQRIDPTKEPDKIFEAIKLTKSDFIVLQTDWGQGEYYEKILKNIPPKVKLIPKILRSKMAFYYVSSDALLGQIGYGGCGSIEREAILSNIPVFCYETKQFTDNDPFCKSKDPVRIAKYIDRIVEHKDFRLELLRIQQSWIKKYFDPKKLETQWDKLFLEIINENHKYKVKTKYNVVMKLFFNS